MQHNRSGPVRKGDGWMESSGTTVPAREGRKRKGRIPLSRPGGGEEGREGTPFLVSRGYEGIPLSLLELPPIVDRRTPVKHYLPPSLGRVR